MSSVSIRFYAHLNELLSRSLRQVAFTHEFVLQTSVKDLIESFGIPHTEVDLLLANGHSVDFSYLVRDGDRISVYPAFQSIDISPVTRVRPPKRECIEFILDTHLGKLASLLRLFGFDTLYCKDCHDEELARMSGGEDRILLTRDRRLLMRKAIIYGYCVRSTEPRQQLVEVIERFDLLKHMAPFQRCLRCNDWLEAVDKRAILDRLPPRVQQIHAEFRACRGCGQVYWPGTHYERMRDFIAAIIQEVRPGTPHEG